jgi:hypothetical protein
MRLHTSIVSAAGLALIAGLACSDAGDDTGSGSGGSAGTGSGGLPAGSGGSPGGGSDSDAGGATCGPPCGMPSGYALGCCDGTCRGFYNDPSHCGECGKVCPAAMPYCNNGACAVPPCSGASCQAGETCCGSACCQAGQICCGVNVGPFVMQCHTPTEQEPSCPLGCPSCVCASPDTPIATPEGERPIASLAVGDLVYSVDDGAVLAVPIARVGQTRATGHHVQRVVLASGAVLEISAPHPTADGRTFADLTAGSMLDGIEVVSVESIAYTHPFTYDILPASDSGAYFAGGVLIGSTLAR